MARVYMIFEGVELTQSKFNEIEKFVLEYFCSLQNDVRESIYILRKKDTRFVKSELCLAFIIADSLSRFREIITTGKEEKTNKDRFREWFDSFVLSDKNETYKKFGGEISCSSSTLWKLRNSLLHFYGLPDSEPICFCILNQTEVKKLKYIFSKKHPDTQLIVVNPYRLIESILGGLLIQGETLLEMIRGNDDTEKESYIKNIVKCYEIIRKEGTIYMSLKK